MKTDGFDPVGHDTSMQPLARPALTILFVDPDVEYIRAMAAPFTNTGSIAIVPSARGALSAMTARRPDIIVMELDLPDVKGLDFITRLRTTPETRHMLLMVLTKRTGLNDKINAFKAGADDYLVKSITREQFETHVRLLSRFRQVIRR